MVTHENESHVDERNLGNEWVSDCVFIQTSMSTLSEISVRPSPSLAAYCVPICKATPVLTERSHPYLLDWWTPGTREKHFDCTARESARLTSSVRG